MRLDCGISPARLQAWLDNELALNRDEQGWLFLWEGASCRVVLAPLENRKLGYVSLERTELAVEGDELAENEFMRLFTLRFASAGG